MACEHSVYCDEAVISDRSQGVYGFKSFVVKFMIRMAVVSTYVFTYTYVCVCLPVGAYECVWLCGRVWVNVLELLSYTVKTAV